MYNVTKIILKVINPPNNCKLHEEQKLNGYKILKPENTRCWQEVGGNTNSYSFLWRV